MKLTTLTTTLLASLTLASTVRAADIPLQCKNWQGEVLADVVIDFKDPLPGSMDLDTFQQANKDGTLMTPRHVDIRNFASNDQANDLSQATTETWGDSLMVYVKQEESTDDYELDMGKGVTLEIPDAFYHVEIVGERRLKKVGLSQGIIMGRLMGIDHGEDGTRRDVICNIGLSSDE